MEKSTKAKPAAAASAAAVWASGFDCGRSAAFREITTYVIGLLVGFMVARLLFKVTVEP